MRFVLVPVDALMRQRESFTATMIFFSHILVNEHGAGLNWPTYIFIAFVQVNLRHAIGKKDFSELAEVIGYVKMFDIQMEPVNCNELNG